MATDTQTNNRMNTGFDEDKNSIQRAVGEGLRQAKDNFQEVQKAVTKEAKATMDKTQVALTNKAKDALQQTTTYVNANPWAAVGIAAAAGLFVGLLISRKD